MDKSVLITGSSSGIGRAAAQLFQEKGWKVAATMRSPEAEQELGALDNVAVSRLDVTDSDSIASAVKGAIDQFGHIDVLVNNAGYGVFGPLEATPMENVRRQFDTNVIGLVDVTKAVVPHFRERKQGTIVNISSMAGKLTFPLASMYHGTKFAVEGITEAMSYEMEPIGAKVKLVEPGFTATDFAERSLDFQNDEAMAEYQGVVAKLFEGVETMAQNASTAEHIAEVIYGAATDGTDQLRYPAGEDAKALIAARASSDDATFMATIKQQLGF